MEKNSQKIPQYYNICLSIGVWTSIGKSFFFNNAKQYNMNVDKKKKLNQGISTMHPSTLPHTTYLLTTINEFCLILHLNL